MGIDAELVIKYRGEKPTEDQLTRWSWDIGRAIGARHFFISDGLPPAEYSAANKAWHAAFDAHPRKKEWDALRSSDWNSSRPVHDAILADVGKTPEQLRRAIELTCAHYDEDDFDENEDARDDRRGPGLVYFQDGPPVYAEPGEWLLKVSVWTRFYGEGYERGDILTLCAMAEWIEVNMQPCEVWYGGDSSGCLLERFDNNRRTALRAHLYGEAGRNYFQYESPPVNHPPQCGLCVKGENRFSTYGWGQDYSAVSCAGCGKSFESRDGAKTWTLKVEKA